MVEECLSAVLGNWPAAFLGEGAVATSPSYPTCLPFTAFFEHFVTPLHRAAIVGDIQEVKQLLAKERNRDQKIWEIYAITA